MAPRSPPSTCGFGLSRQRVPAPGPVSAVDEDHIWSGLVQTADGGRSWTAWIPQEPESARFADFEMDGLQFTRFISDRHGWFSSGDRVRATNDGGESWTMLFSGHIHAISLLSSGRGWMGVGDGSAVHHYITADLGRTWRECG